MISPLDFLRTEQDLRELLRGYCQPQDLEPLLKWAWPVITGHKLLVQLINGEVTVGFDPDMDGPVFSKS